MSKFSRTDRQLHHFSASSTQIKEGMPTVHEGNEGDLTLRHVRGKGVYIFAKFRNRWYSRQLFSGQGRNTGVGETGLQNPADANLMMGYNDNTGEYTGVDIGDIGFGSPGKLESVRIGDATLSTSGTGTLAKLTVTPKGGATITLSDRVKITDNESTTENNLITFVADASTATGYHGLEMDGDFHYNPNTGLVTATGFKGALTGNASGSSGSCTGNSATATLSTTVTVTDSSANTNFPIVLHDESNALLDDTGSFTYNPSTGTLSAANIIATGDITLDDGGSLKEAGGTAAITFDGSGHVTKIGQDSPSNGQVLTWDTSGSPNKAVWSAAPVDATGTPVDSQIAVWTDADTLEGTAALTFDGSTLQVTQTGDAALKIIADSDNDGEGDNPLIELSQDDASIKGFIGFEGEAGTLYTGSIKNSLFIQATSSSSFPEFQNIQFVTGGHLTSNGTARMTIYADEDGDTASGGTATKYTHIAMNAPTVTAEETSVTTTNATNLYINAAPSASTNQTFTNAYALWVDAGESRFDGGVKLAYDDTHHCVLSAAANGVTTIATTDHGGNAANLNLDIDGAIIIDAATGTISLKDNGSTYTPSASSDVANKGYVDTTQYWIHRAGINYNLSGGTFAVIPLEGSTRPTTNFLVGETTTMIMPFDGSLERVYFRSEEVAGDPVVIGFHKQTSGTELPSVIPTATVSIDMSSVADDTSTAFNFTSNNTFSAGDIVGFSINPDNDINDSLFTFVFKFDITT